MAELVSAPIYASDAAPVKVAATQVSPIQSGADSDTREYDSARVDLIDYKTGALGVTLSGESSQETVKRAFVVDPDNIYVGDALGRPIDFSDIQVGHQLKIICLMDKKGKETVDEIDDRSFFENN